MNCANAKFYLDFEKLGSKLYLFLKDNKIDNSKIIESNNSLTGNQLEKILHGAQLKSYDFSLYKTNKKNKDSEINLNVFIRSFKKTNLLRYKLKALLESFSYKRLSF